MSSEPSPSPLSTSGRSSPLLVTALRRQRADTAPRPLTPRNEAAAAAHLHALHDSESSSTGSYSTSSYDSDHDDIVVPELNLNQADIDERLAATKRADEEESVKARAKAALSEPAPQSSSSSSHEGAHTNSDEEEAETSGGETPAANAVPNSLGVSPRRVLIERALRHKEQTTIVQKFLHSTSCNYSFTALHECVWRGLNDTQREQFWVCQCITSESSILPSIDALISGARLPTIVYSAIMTDLYRTNPDAAAENRYFINTLYRGLMAHAALRPDIGYVQGMNLLWSQIIMCISKPQQQLLVAEHIVRNVLPYYFTTDFVGAAIDASVLRYYLTRRCANLEAFMREKFGTANVHYMLLRITGTWFTPLCINLLRSSHRKRLWDMIMMRGAVALFEFTLRLLIYSQKRGWVDRYDEWVDFIICIENHLRDIKSLDPILKTRLPSGRLIYEDFASRRRSATRIVFEQLRASVPLTESGHIVD